MTKMQRREALTGLLFISPWIVGFLVFTLGAMVYSLVISFSRYQLATDTARPIGLANYQQLIEDPKIVTALANTLYYAVLAVPLEVLLALGLALLLNSAKRGALRKRSSSCATQSALSSPRKSRPSAKPSSRTAGRTGRP